MLAINTAVGAQTSAGRIAWYIVVVEGVVQHCCALGGIDYGEWEAYTLKHIEVDVYLSSPCDGGDDTEVEVGHVGPIHF